MGDIPHEWRKWLVDEKGYSTHKLPSDPWELYHPVEGRRIPFPAEHSDTAFMTDQALSFMQQVRAMLLLLLRLYCACAFTCDLAI